MAAVLRESDQGHPAPSRTGRKQSPWLPAVLEGSGSIHKPNWYTVAHSPVVCHTVVTTAQPRWLGWPKGMHACRTHTDSPRPARSGRPCRPMARRTPAGPSNARPATARARALPLPSVFPRLPYAPFTSNHRLLPLFLTATCNLLYLLSAFGFLVFAF